MSRTGQSRITGNTARSTDAPMLFSSLPLAMRDRLSAPIIPRQYADGQLIHARGDRCDGFWVIDSGSVAIGESYDSGAYRMIALLGPGDSWGEMALLSGGDLIVEASARGATALRFVPAAALNAELAREPQAMRALLTTMALQLREALLLLSQSRTGSVSSRLAWQLANLANNCGTDVPIPVTQHELASLVSATRGAVNAALAQFEAEGLIRRAYGRIAVRDPAALRERARG